MPLPDYPRTFRHSVPRIILELSGTQCRIIPGVSGTQCRILPELSGTQCWILLKSQKCALAGLSQDFPALCATDCPRTLRHSVPDYPRTLRHSVPDSPRTLPHSVLDSHEIFLSVRHPGVTKRNDVPWTPPGYRLELCHGPALSAFTICSHHPRTLPPLLGGTLRSQ